MDGTRLISFGLPGSSDLLGIISPHGKILCIEVKTGNARQSKQQKAFQNMVIKFGGIYVVARSIHDVDFLIQI